MGVAKGGLKEGGMMSEEEIMAMQKDMEWKVVDMDSCLEGNPFWFDSGEEKGGEGSEGGGEAK